jgi:hypothetical protein
MRGWLRVDAAAVGAAGPLEQWVARGVAHARSLPAKGKGRRRSTGATGRTEPQHDT